MSVVDGHRGRLKEKFLNEGIASFYHDYEKLEFLLTFIIPRKDVKPIAKALLEKFGTLEEVIKSDVSQLVKIHGVGESTAIFLKYLSELNKILFKNHSKKNKLAITSKSELLNYIRNFLCPYIKNEIGFENRENFFVLYLDSANQLINDCELKSEVLFKGTLDRSAVYPREILGRIIENREVSENKGKVNSLEELGENPRKILGDVIKYRAKSIIFAHNHPSGNYKPSRSDIELTQSLKATLGMLDVKVLDHIIVTRESYFSFLEEGLLE